jgi:hypothetical protein
MTCNNGQHEFISEYSIVKIIIKKKFPKINLIMGVIGPFSKGDVVAIPFWVANILNRFEICRITYPKWLKINWLEKKIYNEKNLEGLQAMPFNYFELSKILIIKTEYKICLNNTIMTLIEILCATRFIKIWKCIKKIKGNIDVIVLNEISSIEILSYKQVFLYLLTFFSYN